MVDTMRRHNFGATKGKIPSKMKNKPMAASMT